MYYRRFCPKGHDKNLVGRTAKNFCKGCRDIYMAKWRINNPMRTHKDSNNQGFRKAGIKNVDGSQFTFIDYDRAYQVQQGRCAGCGLYQSEQCRRLDADHDHKTGLFRFLLCMNCNRVLGHAKDSPRILRHLADKLDAFKCLESSVRSL